MMGSRQTLFSRLGSLAVILSACAALITTASALQSIQTQEPPLPTDPTPLRDLITNSERASLLAARDPKKIVEVLLTISDSHLNAALAAINGDDYRKSELELDIYRKALAEAGKTTFALTDGKRKLAKKIELKLRDQIRTLDQIDHRFPLERERFAAAAIDQARHLRIKALNEAFASDVLKDPDEKNEQEAAPRKKGAALYFSGANIHDAGAAQLLSGDYLTEEEDNHIREAQQIEPRVRVFMKIADRRLAALSGPLTETTDKKELKKRDEETREWGTLPKLSRAELLTHYKRTIEEGMAKLEDAYERNPKASAIPRALQHLKESTDRHLQLLKSLQPEAEPEKVALSRAIGAAEMANEGARDAMKHQ